MQIIPKRFFLTLLILTISAVMISSVAASEKRPPDGKVAVVNGTVITQENFDREMKQVRQRLDRMGRPLTGSQLSDIEKRVLERLINNELLDQAAKKKGVKIDEQVVDDHLNKIKKRFPNEVEFKKAIEMMNLSEEDIKLQIEKSLSVRKIIDQEVAQKITITPKETKVYYDGHLDMFKKPEEIRASHILIKVESGSDKSQKTASYKKIEEVQKKIEQGGDFATLAKEFSEGPTNVKGGDLGFFTRGRMVKPFEEAAFALSPGEVSGIVETPFGYHIIKVYEKKPATTLAYGEVKDKLQEYLKQQEVKKQLEDYIKELKSKSKIEIFMT